MAEKEDMAPEEGGKKIVAYKLLQGLGDGMEEGQVIHLPEDKGEALCKAGLAEEANEDEVAGNDGDEAEEMAPAEETPIVANAVNKLQNKIEKGIASTVAKVMAKTQTGKTVDSVPASVREPIYKSAGAYIHGIIKAKIFGDRTEMNRVNAYQKEAAEAWTKLGVRLKAPLGINETTSAEGGFLINPQYSDDVYAIPHGQIDLLSQCEAIEAQSNVYNQRFVNESSLANGSIFGGLNMVATAEGASFTSSLPAWSNVTFTLQKLAIFVYYTTEVLQDASYPIESELNDYVNKAFIYGINTQIVQGSTLEGLLNAPSLVTVTSSSNDTAWHTTPSTNLTYADLASMWASVYPDCKSSPKGMWLYHPSLENPLSQMTYTFSGANPAWSIQYDAREGLGTQLRIFGKPAFPCWACSAPGNAGDILFVDFATVKAYKKPFRVEVSKEFQFGTDQVAVRFVNRLDAKTVFRNKVTGVNGTQQFSSIVTRSAAGT